MLSDFADESGCDVAEAVVAIINARALERRRELIEQIRANAPTVPGDSTDIIREDRDSR